LSKIKAAIVGSGLIAGKKHIPAFLNARRSVNLVAICDLNLESANKLAERFGIPKTYNNVAELITAERPDLVDICTPPVTHVQIAVEAMRLGCHVLIEKPMALNIHECDQIINASQEYGVKVCVGHSDLFYAPFMRARKMVSQGAIGAFRGMRILLSTPKDYMTSREDHWAHKLPGGVLGETGPHVVYMTLAFLKRIRNVSVDAIKLLHEYPWSRFEDYRINLVGDEAISSITLSYTSNQWAARVELLGDRGILVADLQTMNVVRYRRPELKPFAIGFSLLGEAAQLASALAANTVNYATGSMRSTHDIIISEFVDSIRNGTEPPIGAEEGREAVRVLNLIVEELEAKAAMASAVDAHIAGGSTGR
jgi:predicted dehydrogenase